MARTHVTTWPSQVRLRHAHRAAALGHDAATINKSLPFEQHTYAHAHAHAPGGGMGPVVGSRDDAGGLPLSCWRPQGPRV